MNALVLALAVFAAAGPAPAEISATTVILVRHAEKAAETMSDDVPLSDAGAARAKELARVLRGAEIDAIYTTQWLRTRQTAEPLAKEFGVEPRIVQSGKTYAADLASKIRAEHDGQTVLVVGHSNSTSDLLRRLGAAHAPAIADSQYDDLFVLTIVGTTANVVALRYGAPSR